MSREPKIRDVTPYSAIFCAQVLMAQYFEHTPTRTQSTSCRNKRFYPRGIKNNERPAGGPICRVQVKSTIYCRRGNQYSLNVMGPGRKQY